MASAVARHHHYLSQFYLKGFTDGRSKKSKLTVFDLTNEKIYRTTPRNVGGVRDFNRIEVSGFEPTALEKEFAQFESRAATALKSVEKSLSLEGENKEIVLNLIALLAMRSPQMRENIRQFHADIAEKMMGLTLATKERWESQVQQMREAGHELEGDVSYEDMKAFHEGKRYHIDVAREWHIALEMKGVEAILPFLFERKWLLMNRNSSAGPFITADRPVLLLWKDPDSVPYLMRQSPGFGLNGTIVYFPVSQELQLVGDFDGQDLSYSVDNETVANINTLYLQKNFGRIFTPKRDFPFVARGGRVSTGNEVAKHLKLKSKD